MKNGLPIFQKANPLLKRYVKPHSKESRMVYDGDTSRILEDSEVLNKLCHLKWGIYENALALAHCQIDDNDPLRFFVTADGEAIINPIIVKHTKHPVESEEGCMSFEDKGKRKVMRYNKMEVGYQMLQGGSLSHMIYKEISGQESKVWQHELDHMDGKYIYPLKEKK